MCFGSNNMRQAVAQYYNNTSKQRKQLQRARTQWWTFAQVAQEYGEVSEMYYRHEHWHLQVFL